MSDIVIETPVVVEAGLNYLVPNGERPVTYAYEPPAGVPLRNGVYRAQRVRIANARITPPPGGLALDRNGFELRRHASALTDFSDPAAIERVYYPESEALLKRCTGAKRVVIFDHTLRDGRATRADGVREPVKYVHNDQTFVSGPRRVRDHLSPQEAQALLKGRVAIVNLWRPVGETVESSPLALCDSRSIALTDLVPSDLVYRDKIGETYAFVFNPAHRWYYFPHMTPDEVLLLKIYDSAGDSIARLTAHTAFDDPSSPPDAPARRSIELRSLVFF
ncbi:CmcJ/NvfI family oxidoreductase [Paraburkholderia kururiensis]|uniref:CmcJ/NvfI family oxidoreductase n=1 Tax=Paraburkholderia kururiensis TaxID=984307 RepID=A0ABZ0WJ00_9BURK|nr:CmcJ/NvfI family oxidoreductase [Paraburkholderia kururiensis]WQD77332.1 CmcJ/NvfI family oxidoreductase [Paraburkholderia kururiensis]